jgi:predicted metal-dependent hydrolase
LPWPALLRAIANSGYDGPLVIEGALGNDPPATMARVRACLDPVLRSLSAGSDLCAGAVPPGVEEGIRLFNEGRFYECHEAIEHEWHAERSPVRALYQGILQIGVGFHHARSGNYQGAVALLRDGITKVSRFVPRCRGIDTARLVQESQACLDRIIKLGPDRLAAFDWSAVPRVHLLDAQEPEVARQPGDGPHRRAGRDIAR